MSFSENYLRIPLSMIYFLIAAVSHWYVIEPVVEMREEPSFSSKVVSQALFAEGINNKDVIGDWAEITTPDGYSGWTPSKGLTITNVPYQTTIKTSRLKAHLYAIDDTEYGPILTLPYGSPLKVIDDIDKRWLKVEIPGGKNAYIQRGDVKTETRIIEKKDLIAFSQKFMDLPYTWGGRSSFGYDCSGFVQMLYSQIGIQLQRDAKQQILDERFQDEALDSLEPGDLIFFGKQNGQIGHVGMSIGNDQFIHACVRENLPWIRISSLKDAEWSGQSDAYYPYRHGRRLIAGQPLKD